MAWEDCCPSVYVVIATFQPKEEISADLKVDVTTSTPFNQS